MKIILLSILSICLSGCVSSSRHKSLEAELQRSQEQMAIAKAINQDLQKKLGETETSNTELEVSVSEMQEALEELTKRKAETERRVAEYQSLTQRFQKLVDSGKLKVRMENGKMILALPSDVLFSSGSAELSEKGHRTIVQTAQLLEGISGKQFQIEGHTDNIPIKSARFPSNWELASARSISVLKTMLEAGLGANRISAASYADTKPVLSNKTKEDRMLNRRIEISVVPDLSLLPGHDELSNLSQSK